MSNRRQASGGHDISQTLNSLDGARIPGGCGTCDAYQTIQSQGHPAVAVLTVHHDDWCPTLQLIKTGRTS